MIIFPCAKINLGLNVVRTRRDGYHDIETVFYPIPLCDALEIKHMSDNFPAKEKCLLKVSGATEINCDEADNLVVKAYCALAERYELPRVYANLYKRIPSEAGLGGGSSDAAHMIRLLDERFRLNIGNSEMEQIAATIGADCPFFISAEPAYAQGIGDQLEPADAPEGNLEGYYVLIAKPQVSVSTRDAYAAITPHKPAKCCRDIVRQPIETWRDELVNDFEEPAFAAYPELKALKQSLYDTGALYASMTGSGSAFYGIYRDDPTEAMVSLYKADRSLFLWKGELK